MSAVEELLEVCPVCDETVIVMKVQGGMRLDFPAVDRAENRAALFALQNISGHWLAGSDGADTGQGHTLHAHQPEGVT